MKAKHIFVEIFSVGARSAGGTRTLVLGKMGRVFYHCATAAGPKLALIISAAT